jgi:4-oxalocrotonate tautomerase
MKGEMPLVRISLMQGRPQGFGKKVREVVYGALLETVNVPAKDNFQVITEHGRDSLIYDPGYLGVPGPTASSFSLLVHQP